jgi:broad specificity phosphatase PhoE
LDRSRTCHTSSTASSDQKGEYNPDAVDPLLSQIGKEQMANLAEQLRSELPKTGEGMILPTKVFTSILRRTCQCSIDVWAPVCDAPIIALQVSRGYQRADE